MEYVPVASSVIAGLSLCLNAYLAYLLRTRPTIASRRDYVRSTLYNLKNKIDSTSLMTTTPHYEMWDYGFKSLADLRMAAVECLSALETAPHGQFPAELTRAVKTISDDIKDLYRYRDSYRRFSKDKLINSQDAMLKWSDFEGAKHALSALQHSRKSYLPVIDSNLTKLY